MKNLDKIPGLQLVKRGNSGIEKFELGKDAFPFRGYFIAIIPSEGPISIDSPKEQREKLHKPDYVFSGHKITSHPILKKIFQKRHKDCLEEGNRFIITNGGELEITEDKIRFYGKSSTFGKYEPSSISQIVERFVDRNLPDHEIIYE
ncbi:MAG: hypothetical protein ABIA78_00650 [archaeon]